MRNLIFYLFVSWRWLRAVFSLKRIVREMEMMPYRGQPVHYDWKRKRFYVVPRTTLRSRWTRKKYELR